MFYKADLDSRVYLHVHTSSYTCSNRDCMKYLIHKFLLYLEGLASCKSKAELTVSIHLEADNTY